MTQSTPQLPRSAPEAQGLPSAAVLAFVDALGRAAPEPHGLMILRHGYVVAEGWWAPYQPQRPHMLFSLSKSFTATAAGLAVAEGRLSLDDSVLSFFPDDAPIDIGPNLAAMQVRHLLSMSTGHAEDTIGRLYGDTDSSWVRTFLAQSVEHTPGTHFVYNSGASYMVSAIVQKVTGQTLLEFLGPRLFAPLGIAPPTWDVSPQGINTGGWGLSLTTEDIARFGQLYLQNGIWQGERLLPESWVSEATAKQVSNGTDPESDWAQGYGFQFWRCRHNAYRGDGAFGQFCVVLPEQDAVVVVTGGIRDLGAVLSQLWEHLLPALGPSPLSADTDAEAALTARLSSLALAPPSGAASSPTAERVSSRTYTFPARADDDRGIEFVRWDFQDAASTVTLRGRRGEQQIEAGHGQWKSGATMLLDGPMTLIGVPSQAVAAQGAWLDADTYVLKACFTETPFSITVTGRFRDDRLALDWEQNVSFGLTVCPTLEGLTSAV